MRGSGWEGQEGKKPPRAPSQQTCPKAGGLAGKKKISSLACHKSRNKEGRRSPLMEAGGRRRRRRRRRRKKARFPPGKNHEIQTPPVISPRVDEIEPRVSLPRTHTHSMRLASDLFFVLAGAYMNAPA